MDGSISYWANVRTFVLDMKESIKMAAMCVSGSLGVLPAFAFGTLRNGKAFSRALRICWEGVKKFILETVKLAGPNACPPFTVGVGKVETLNTAPFLPKWPS